MISDNESDHSCKVRLGDIYLNDHRLQSGLPYKEGQDSELEQEKNQPQIQEQEQKQEQDQEHEIIQTQNQIQEKHQRQQQQQQQQEQEQSLSDFNVPSPSSKKISISDNLRLFISRADDDGDECLNTIDFNRMKIPTDGALKKRRDSSRSNGSSIRRRLSRSSIDSEPDSHASRSSQETEEDVCFPMLREHVRIKGIDFDEIEEFIKDELQEKELFREKFLNDQNSIEVPNLYKKPSATSIKYTPKYFLSKLNTRKTRDDVNINVYDEKDVINNNVNDDSKNHIAIDIEDDNINFSSASDNTSSSDQVKFGQTRIQSEENLFKQLRPRFSFFNSENEETIHSPDIPGLLAPGQSVQQLFNNGDATWWLDCSCPTDSETKMLAKAFGIHPLTAEDIRMQETREKVELFRNYYFVCFHTFEQDNESEDYLEPINVYIVVFREGVLSFHYSPINHPANVRRRVRQLRDYVDVSADWLCYALIDDITDAFAPVITSIEYEADMIEDSVFVARESDYAMMLRKIGQARREVMTLMRLLAGKADVIKMFAKRCQDEATSVLHHPVHNNHGVSATSMSGIVSPQPINVTNHIPFSGKAVPAAPSPPPINPQANVNYHQFQRVQQPRADIALYLGDIQDHVVTMFQNLVAYEKMFSRSHGNYLAQLQVESVNSSNKMTNMFSKVTIIGTILIPLNLITGLFGMNVHIPGQGGHTLYWFFGIIGVMILMVCIALIVASRWLNKMNKPETDKPSSKSIKSFKLRQRTRDGSKSILSFPNKDD